MRSPIPALLLGALAGSAALAPARAEPVPGAPAAAPNPAAAPSATEPGAAEPPGATALLFETNQLGNAPPGQALSYRYTRFSSIEGAPFGPPVADRIREAVEAGPTPETRNLTVEMFTGARRMPTATYEDVPGNPVLVRFLEHHLDDLARVLKGNPRYIKNAIRRALRESAVVTPTEVEVGGVRRPGWRVVARPFADDPVRDRLRGFDALTYTFVVCAAVPGQIVSIDARAAGPDGGTLLQETLTYEPSAG
ncbi:hypothetical protein OPKNFCMD_4820 [Methylobacterium crusticola]|uniref:Uncharacterized protein n=1 Tax=Methylobacterium crusticola TaxID=1697972 RepID=A0ABQ4R306_9HYPH|nr:hypothetical protein [Methylobacterium crusticola]GJD52058.1 hypothetical protein OPKNFCMD_4820 [Methylobacterium crusticola]